ncbi:hypothetical protein [Streptomyces sp. NPDC017890]|uniref:hypothetical protein n=1 Tax=Streptomyces sp. NPDC017890 TaxID=3365015 RepID=UPI0037AEF4F0
MGRGEAPWPGAAARRFRFTPELRTCERHTPDRRTSERRPPDRRPHRRVAPAPVALALALTAAALATACVNSGTDKAGSGAATEAPASATGRRTPPPAELCVSAVGYWAHEMLHGGEPYGDYQSMGLSNRQYDILREVMDAARATKRDQGARAAEELTGRRVRAACVEQYRDGGPSDGPWQR